MKTIMTVAAVAMAAVAFAQEPAAKPANPGRDQMRRSPMAERMMAARGMADQTMRAVMNPKIAEKLGLTDEQKAKVKALVDGERESLRALQEKAQQATKRQFELMRAEKVDEAAVLSAIDEVFAARKEIAKAQFKNQLAVRAVLSAEQLSKVGEAMKAIRGERMLRRPPAPAKPAAAPAAPAAAPAAPAAVPAAPAAK